MNVNGYAPPVTGRRRFMTSAAAATTAVCLGCGGSQGRTDVSGTGGGLHESRWYTPLGGEKVQCNLCPRECVIPEGERGFCGTRVNTGGRLYSLVYGSISAENLDPIEKKPLFHMLPGSLAYSIATAGCNMTCTFCQNYHLSQSQPGDVRSSAMTPPQIAERAGDTGAAVIAYTYNEPTVFAEYARDCAVEGARRGVRSVVISNGYINERPLESLMDVVAAYKVDFKSFSPSFYTSLTGGRRDPVLQTIKRLHERGVWMELVHLTIPTLNDDRETLGEMARWLMGEVGPDVPVHFTRFHPTYRLTNLPVTPVSTLESARSILMREGMRYVYVGNVPGHPGESTYCHSCGKRIIERGQGYSVGETAMQNGACAFCGTAIPGIWS